MTNVRMIKWGGSDGGQCPAVYVADDIEGLGALGFEPGGFLFQGKALPTDVVAGLKDVADDESAVWVPASLVHEDLQLLLAQLTGQPTT